MRLQQGMYLKGEKRTLQTSKTLDKLLVVVKPVKVSLIVAFLSPK
jgi:hypothetical protein